MALWLKSHYRITRAIIVLAISLPGLLLLFAYFEQNLGVNPLQQLQQQTGHWAFVFLCITLLITPLRRQLAFFSQARQSAYGKRLADWNWIIRTRRLFGLGSFGYAVAHLAVYMHFDLGYDITWAIEDLQQKPFLGIGLIAFVIMCCLALTSPTPVMKQMGRFWRRLHRLIYPMSLLVLWHQWLAVKAGILTPWYFGLVVLLLLGYRILAATGVLINKPRDDGMEITNRKA